MAEGFNRMVEREALNAQLGASGFKRITSASATVSGKFFAIKAISGNATLAAGTAVAVGDAPSSGDVIAQSDVLFGSFTAVQVSSGTVYAYYVEIAV